MKFQNIFILGALAMASAHEVGVVFTLPQAESNLATIENEAVTPITIEVTNNEAIPIVISEAVAVFSVPGKRRSSPYLNFSYPFEKELAPAEVGDVQISPSFSLPTKEYLVKFAVKGHIGEDEEPLDEASAAEVTVKIVDPAISIYSPAFLVSLVVLGLTFLSAGWLALHLLNRSFLESVIPAVLQPYLLPSNVSQQSRRKRN